MRWLQLTDLHVGMKGSKSQETALGNLVRAVSEVPINDELDAIIITGDIAYSGRASEYESFSTHLLQPLRSLPALKNSALITIPGNHDMDCDVSDPIAWDTLGELRKHSFFEESQEGQRVRAPRAASFSEYAKFVNNVNAHSLNPLKEVSSCQFRMNSINIIGTNTAFFSDKDTSLKDEEKTPAPTPSLRTILMQSEPDDRTIIIAHHPIEWFLHNQRESLKSLLCENNAFYLHGHTHQIQARYVGKGILSLGFGATYQAKPDDTPSADYHNNFAICELEEDLHILFYRWDSVHGRWIPTHDLPVELSERSSVWRDGVVVRTPKAKTRRATQRGPISTKSSSTPLSIDSASIICDMQPDDWEFLILRLRLLESAKSSQHGLTFEPAISTPEQIVFRYHSPAGEHRLVIIVGPGHILSRGEVETANMTLDLNDLASYTIVSLGDMSSEAREIYLQLKRRKSLVIITGKDVIASFSNAWSTPQKEHFSKLDGGSASAILLIAKKKFLILIQERQRQSWFYVLGESGEALPESHESVRALRATIPNLANVEYRNPQMNSVSNFQPVIPHQSFERDEYLSTCHKEFNSIRYTALATIGLRFHNITLEELYVETNAHSTTNSRGTVGDALSRAIDETLEGLQLDEHLRAQLEAQLRQQLGATSTGEARAARWLYQEHGSILVLGDPGSGKTCFVKHEIMNYCNAKESWYAHHIPIFVPLAEAARLFGDDGDLLSIACSLAAKRGIQISEIHIKELVSKGVTAFFFDGVDEVVSVDKRAQLFDAIVSLMKTARPLGNRFVVTSRPAAVQLIDIPNALKVISLRGLTNDEMRILARRVLAIRFSENESGMRLGIDRLNTQDNTLVDQLMRDCEATPGIARIARNPLLLTLLVMIYANSGPLAAKRHRVYAQAVQTLVSVRGRELGQRVFSEADLRRRLGAIALSVYTNLEGSIPSKRDVHQTVARVMATERNTEIDSAEVDKFIQDVAESTGIILIHKGGVNDGNHTESITFMHHSFLEYYAALGLYTEGYKSKLVGLARQARWREVVTLLAGIVGDYDDAYPLICEILETENPEENITLNLLTFAFDCALECDVPTEMAQRALISRVDSAIRNGPARLDPELRSRLAERIGKLLAITGSLDINSLIIKGLRDRDIYVVAAYIDLVGHIAVHTVIDKTILDAFQDACTQHAPIIVIAVCGAIAREKSLRTDKSLATLRGAMRKSVPERLAAVKSAEESPALINNELQSELIQLLDDSHRAIARSAASAIICSGMQVGFSDDRQRHVLRKILLNLETPTGREKLLGAHSQFSKNDVDQLLSSPNIEERQLGLRMLSWVPNEEQFVYDRIMSVLREATDHMVLTSALAALRLVPKTQKLLRLADVDFIRLQLGAKTRDVRISACELLGEIKPTTDPDGNIKALVRYFEQHQRDVDEFQTAISALVSCGSEMPNVRDIIIKFTTEHLKNNKANKGRDTGNILELLRACQMLRTEIPEAFVERLLRMIDSRDIADTLRRELLLTFVCIARPARAVKALFQWLRKPRAGSEGSLFYATARFLVRCRRRFEHVREISSDLGKLLEELLSYSKKSSLFRKKNDDSATMNLRIAVEEVQQMLNSYGEFARRKSA